jgi:ribosomal-protein-alanine N-acetyltransferase
MTPPNPPKPGSRASLTRAQPVLVTPRLVVRMAHREDAARIAAYTRRTREAFRAFEPTRTDAFFTEDFWREQAGRSALEFARDQGLRLFLFKLAPGGEPRQALEPIGSANFNQIVRGPFQACTLGYALDPAHQGQGLMHEALQAAIGYVFNELGLHRVMANYMPSNAKSAAVLKRLGFTIEGQARDYILINGRWEDHVLTSLVNPHWQP